MPILYAGNRVTYVDEELAASFQRGDRLIVVQSTGDLLHVPAADHEIAENAVAAAARAFDAMGTVTDDQIIRVLRSLCGPPRIGRLRSLLLLRPTQWT